MISQIVFKKEFGWEKGKVVFEKGLAIDVYPYNTSLALCLVMSCLIGGIASATDYEIF